MQELVSFVPSHNVHSTPLTQTQLQFNFNSQPSYSKVRKPKPIIIEKLMPCPLKGQVENVNERPPMLSTNSLLSSEKLAMAVSLAKMDVKKLKNMLASPTKGEEVLKSKIVPRKQGEEKKVKKAKTNKADEEKRYSIHLYPQSPSLNVQPSIPHQELLRPAHGKSALKTDKELFRLREQLVQHSKTLSNVIENLSCLSQEVETDNIAERNRKIVRMEEQTNRSARTLYALRHQVDQLKNDLQRDVPHTKKAFDDAERSSDNKNDGNDKDCYKSQTSVRLASAHRAAVRALQEFVSHAPMYYSTNKSLPVMYRDLASLIQQLSLISAELPTVDHLNNDSMQAIENLMTRLNSFTSERTNTKHQPSIPATRKVTTKTSKDRYLAQKIDWLKKKADQLQILHDRETSPERAATMKHAMQILDASGYKKPLKTNVREKLNKKPKSVLLPPHLKKTRTMRPQIANNFAAPTVISRIRERPPIDRPPLNSPPTTPKKKQSTWHVVHTMPRQRDEKIVDEARLSASPATSPQRMSPHSEGRRSPVFIDSSAKWPSKRVQPGSIMTKEDLCSIRREISIRDPLVENAVAEINDKLKPLLDKAQMIADEDARRTEEYKMSMKRRLADVASQKAISEGERLAEYILDDLLQETALDMQRLEFDAQAEIEAAFMFDRPTLETVGQRLESMEAEEENMRRRYQSVNYADLTSDEQLMRQQPLAFTSQKAQPTPGERSRGSQRDVITVDLPSSVHASILHHQKIFTRHHFNEQPISELGELILDTLLNDVATELQTNCNEFVTEIYEKEFVQPRT